MRHLQGAPAWAQRIMLGAVATYFGIWIGSVVFSSAILALASAVLFGLIAIGIGTLLAVEATPSGGALAISGVVLALGGVLELVWIASVLATSAIPIASQLASLLVFLGILGYVYAAWMAA